MTSKVSFDICEDGLVITKLVTICLIIKSCLHEINQYISSFRLFFPLYGSLQ